MVEDLLASASTYQDYSWREIRTGRGASHLSVRPERDREDRHLPVESGPFLPWSPLGDTTTAPPLPT